MAKSNKFDPNKLVEGIFKKLPPIIPPVISDFVKDQYNKEGILNTTFKPYVEVYKGMTDPIYNYNNYPETYEDYVDKIVNEDGINRMTGKDREFYLNHEPTYNEFIRHSTGRALPAKAQYLSGESGYGRFSRGATNAIADAAQLGALLPNDFGFLDPLNLLDDVFTMENIGKLRRDYVVDEEMAAKFDMTVDEANQFIREHDGMASLGYYGAIAASMPVEDILFAVAGKSLMKGGAFAGKKTGELLSDLKYLDEPDAGSLFLNTANTKPSSLGAATPYNQTIINNLQDTGVNNLNRTSKGNLEKETVAQYVEKNNDSFLEFNKNFKLDKIDINAHRKFIKYQNSKLDFFKEHAGNPNTEKVWNKIESRFFNIDATTASKNKKGITQPVDNNSKTIVPPVTITLGKKYLAMGENPTHFDTGKPITIDEWFDPPSSINEKGASPDKRRLALQYGADYVQSIRRQTTRSSTTKAGQGDAWAKAQANKQLQWMKIYEEKTGLKKYKEIKDPITNSFRGIKEIDTNVVWLKDGLIPVNNPASKVVEKTIREHPHFKNIQFLHEGVQDIKRATLTPSIAEDFLNEFDDIYITTMGKEGDKFNFNMFANYVDLASQGKNLTTFAPRTFTNSYVEMHHTKGIINDPLTPTMIQNTSRPANSEAVLILTRFNKNIDNGVDLEKALAQVKEEMAVYPTLRLNIPVGDEFIQVGKNLNPKETSKILKEDILKKYNALKKTNPNLVKEMGDFFGLGKKTTAQKLDGNSMGGTPIPRTDFALGDRVTLPENNFTLPEKDQGIGTQILDEVNQVKSENRNLSRKLENAPNSMRTLLAMNQETNALESFRNLTVDKRNQIIFEMEDVQKRVADSLTPRLPVKYRLTKIPKLFSENIFFKKFKKELNTGPLIMGAIANDIINKMSGEDPKVFEERFPVLAKNLIKPFAPVSATKDEAAYIDGFDEINRAIETGVSNLGFNTMDLVLSGIDLASLGNTDLATKLRDLHDKRNINEPETFLGDMGALLVEYGVPGGIITKLMTRAQKALRIGNKFGKINTLPRYITDDLTGKALRARQGFNIAKRMGTGAVMFGLTDLYASGPYSSVNRMFPDDATILPGEPEKTSNLVGNDLVLANFRNRVRFAADGVVVGGLFPLLGPLVLKGAGKLLSLPFKEVPGVGYSVAGAGAKVIGGTFTGAADLLAGKIPFTNKLLPYNIDKIGVPGQVVAKGIQQAAAFVGKQVFTRALLGLSDVIRPAKNIFGFGTKLTAEEITEYGESSFARKLPDFEKWRLGSVNSEDPLNRYLAQIDNKLAMFRDIGKLTKDAFALSSDALLGIKSKSRIIDKYLKNVEATAYDMAKQFEERAQKYGEFESFQKKYLDDVLDYVQGNLKKNQLPAKIRDSAENLKAYTNELKLNFKNIIPEDNALFKLLSQNIEKYMRGSFKIFTNADYNPDPKSVKAAHDFVKKLLLENPGTRENATKLFPDLSLTEAVAEMARLKVSDLLMTARYEASDPLNAFKEIGKSLELDSDIKYLTGEELPKVLRTLLGEEKNLRSSVLQTTGNIISSTYQKASLDRIAIMGLENGWLFNTAEEALYSPLKIRNAAKVTDIKGAGFLPSDVINLYGSPEIVKQLSGYSIFDSALKYKLYQNLIAFKATVQGGKTLYSPATQMRNFGSAAFFALNSGHIGGDIGVAQGFKLVLDDIFGAGSKIEQEEMIKVLERKVQLGVFDESVKQQELGGILRDLKTIPGEIAKGESISTFNSITQKLGASQVGEMVQRLYAGGDNIWKFYGHEFYMSELQGAIRSIDDVKSYFTNIMGRNFDELSLLSGKTKTVAEGIEEIAAYMTRETYPTYSRVPPIVQAIRKLPIGNFISFPAEIIRTSATTTSLALKHIASDSPALRALGYRSLMGQFTTMYGFNQGVSALSSYATGINQETIQAYTKRLGPDFMKDHTLMAISEQDKDGTFKAFNLSTYHPYDYVIAPVQSFLTEINKERLDPDKIEGEVYNRYMEAFRPFFKQITPFIGESIGFEPFIDIWLRGGKAANGKVIFSTGPGGDDFGTKIDKSFNHIVRTISPGFIRSGEQVLGALTLDIKGGRVMDLSDTLVKLLGGSIMNVDPKQALDYKARDIRDIRTNAFRSEIFFSKSQARGRNLPAEYEDIIKQDLQGQFEMYMLFKDSMDTGLLTKAQIIGVLGPDGRNVPNLDNLIAGKFSPPSYSEATLKDRAKDLKKEYEKLGIYHQESYFFPKFKLDRIRNKYENVEFDNFIDPNRQEGNQYDFINPYITVPGGGETPTFGGENNFELPDFELPDVEGGNNFELPDFELPDVSKSAPPVAPLPESSPVNVATAQPATGQVDQATGLTSTESALLDRDEQLIRQRQRGIA